MKKLIMLTVILIGGFITSAKSETKFINHSNFEFGFFYSNLSPYGRWIEMDAGLIVWRPTIIRKGWTPYREGRWIWTVDGWYWDSYEPFGHIVFHYGRWYYDDYYGWIWVPDYDWAPAWVEWRYDDYYIGWAPLAPYAVFSIYIGIHYTHSYYVPYHHWHFVKYNRFCDPYVYNYYIAPKYKYRVYNSTKYRNNYGYRNGRIINHGVDIGHIRKRSGQDIKERDIIRTNDYREVEKYRDKNNDVVRTFVASRDELTKKGSNDVRIERTDKKSTLDVTKVKLRDQGLREKKSDNNTGTEHSAGRDREVRKNTDSRIDVNKERNYNQDVVKKTEVEIKRNENIKTERKNTVIIPEKKMERNDTPKNEVNTQGNEIPKREINKQNNDVRTNSDVKRENPNNSRINVELQKKEVQRKEVNTQKSNDVKVNTQVKRENTNIRPNTQQQRKETNTQVRTEQNRNNTVNQNETQKRKVEEKNNSDNDKIKRSR